MINASGGRLHITSGFRSVAQQQQLWDAAVKKYGSAAAARKWVAPPGDSHHNKGVAADLGGDLAWAHANAARFGLKFPMPWEAWHIEPADLKSTSGHTTPPSTGIDMTPKTALPPDNATRLANVANTLSSLRSLFGGSSVGENIATAMSNLVNGNPADTGADPSGDLVDHGAPVAQNDLVARGQPVTTDPLEAA